MSRLRVPIPRRNFGLFGLFMGWLLLSAIAVANDVAASGAAQNVVYVNLPASIDGRVVGNLNVGVTGTALYTVDRQSWIDFANGHFDADVIASIAQAADDQAIPVVAFIEEFIDIFFDPATLEIKIDLAESRRRTRQVSLRPQDVDYANLSEYELPGRSAYVNVNLQQDYRWDDSLSSDQRQSTLVNVDGSVEIFGSPRLVLEGGVSRYSAAGIDDGWQRSEVRLVHDDMQRAVRYSLGDVFYRATEFQVSPPLLGLSVERAYAEIQPHRNITPTGTRSFTVTQRSTVEIYVNDLYQDTLYLEPGRYDLSDFAINAGVNDVALVVTDASGEQRRIEFSLFSDPALLTKGLSEFSFNAGYQRGTTDLGGIGYDYDAPAFSGFYRYGVTDYLTLGANFQGTELQQIAGAEISLATPLGSLATNVSTSELQSVGRGTVASLRWSYDFFAGGARSHQLDVVAVARDDLYTYLGQEVPGLQNKSELRARYSAPGPFDSYISASARHAETFDEAAPVDKVYSFNITRRFGPFNVSLRLEQEISETEEARALVRLSAPLGQRQLVSTQWDSFDETGELLLGRSPNGTVGDFSGGLALRSGVDTYRADLETFYQGNRFQLGMDHSYVHFTDVDLEPDQLSTLRLGSSLAYADGSIGLGRPITDSFVMVRRHESLDSSRILVDERQDGYAAVADNFGPAVVPTVGSYMMRRVRWEAETPPFGYDMGDIEGNAFPFYRSGLVYTAGSEASITAIGEILDTNGNAIGMTVGKITATDEREFAPVTTFTNKAGRFVAQGLAPGAYRIVFPDRGGLSVLFRIEEGATGIVELGIIRERISL
ncbi:Outer membrane usher protein FimD/PapC [Microbulbifer donghaiensis]|uniref:Outer membrane usher protein FimD/PapC n=1 Tax=Microbulbifer donghaiensis TaxID=494016 RepID=A0A1M5EBZ0_9GAMM|nr:fimbria/pilus outer membrane usher protein [Microbulbifer donghaiensis]SHF76793.1 Outer membrane usher protein FimD/PapC [Microbulbifer donghaiensis]